MGWSLIFLVAAVYVVQDAASGAAGARVVAVDAVTAAGAAAPGSASSAFGSGADLPASSGISGAGAEVLALPAVQRVSPAPARGSARPKAADGAFRVPGIPSNALRAYVQAARTVAADDPSCGMTWDVLAGIGKVESDHGRFGGSSVARGGEVRPHILGIVLDGRRAGTQAIRDTDGGRWDGNATFDRALGPMQFLPGTWKLFGKGGDPQNLQAAAAAAGRYLCAGDASVRTARGRWSAVFRYNHSDRYVGAVLGHARDYRNDRIDGPPATRPQGLTEPRPTAGPAVPGVGGIPLGATATMAASVTRF